MESDPKLSGEILVRIGLAFTRDLVYPYTLGHYPNFYLQKRLIVYHVSGRGGIFSAAVPVLGHTPEIEIRLKLVPSSLSSWSIGNSW